jgi:hypothetical protein
MYAVLFVSQRLQTGRKYETLKLYPINLGIKNLNNKSSIRLSKTRIVNSNNQRITGIEACALER